MSSSSEAGLLARADSTDRELVRLRAQLDDLLDGLDAAESTWSDGLTTVAPDYRPRRNLVHYWSIRQNDLRELQGRLAAFGLSSLGRSEPHVEATLRVVRSAVVAILEDTCRPPEPAVVSADEGRGLLRRRSIGLLGQAPADRRTRIMVTLPSQAATDPDLIRRLLVRGMNVARINCAHDDADAWRAMVGHVRRASEATGRSCVVAVVVLDDILCRMAEHHYKKNALLRQLHSWRPARCRDPHRGPRHKASSPLLALRRKVIRPTNDLTAWDFRPLRCR